MIQYAVELLIIREFRAVFNGDSSISRTGRGCIPPFVSRMADSGGGWTRRPAGFPDPSVLKNMHLAEK
jgi:hypothetical protein